MFSIDTIELSTSIPTPSARPERDMTFSVMLQKYMHTNATTTLAGIESATISVGRQSSRNRSRTRIASPPPYTRFSRTESTTRRM